MPMLIYKLLHFRCLGLIILKDILSQLSDDILESLIQATTLVVRLNIIVINRNLLITDKLISNLKLSMIDVVSLSLMPRSVFQEVNALSLEIDRGSRQREYEYTYYFIQLCPNSIKRILARGDIIFPYRLNLMTRFSTQQIL